MMDSPFDLGSLSMPGLVIKATILLSAALALTGLARSGPSRVRHLLWTLTFGLLLGLPVLSLLGPAWEVPILPSSSSAPQRLPAQGRPAQGAAGGVIIIRPTPDAAVPDAASAAEFTAGAESTAAPAKEPLSPARSIPLPLLLWGIGCTAALASLTVSAVRCSRLVRAANPLRDPIALREAEAIRRRSGIRGHVRCFLSPAVTTPMTGGLWKPVVLFPMSAAAWSSERWRVVLMHEMIHVRRRDVLRQFIVRAVLALYWFHPLSWVAARLAANASEEACDEEVLALGIRPSAYATHLLSVAEGVRAHRSVLSLAMAQRAHSRLESRIAVILEPRRPGWSTIATALLVTALGGVGVSVAAAHPVHTAQSNTVSAIVEARIGDTGLDDATEESLFGDAMSVAADPQGRLNVADRLSPSIQVIEPDATPDATPDADRVPANGLLAGMPLVARSVPPAAQWGSAAVVCVGSELQTLDSSSPVRRVIKEDVAVVYRVGVQDDDREGMEQSLLSELGDLEEASCTWSNPGDRYVVIIRYTGAIRRDLTLDPDDPRFQAFAMGYGASAEAAEENATRDARFSTYADESGYEVLVAESWAVADGVAAGADPGAAAAPSGQPGAPGLSSGTEFSDCEACPRMVVVPAGTVTMGSPASEEGPLDRAGPQRSVTIPAPFAVGVHEVTFAEWDACVRAGGCGGYVPDDRGWGRGSRPVINVSWDDAQAYVSWLSQQTGARYRLLSEPEWEYVARAGSRTARYWGQSESSQCRYANGGGPRCDDGYDFTAPVGSFAPNGFGLHDVIGNVFEWTHDCWNGRSAGAPAEGSASQSGECGRRVLRGGAWDYYPWDVRSPIRGPMLSGGRSISLGFRVARALN
ncbi:SUMF1/EgtB/PvdO family nonheme iron enzyme [Candidatus Palauibacter sp.]|uniref:SUMF1/EgtB/PvdO family nonheme iron enzyme n=1 Tax=Candidatus Palauibacter sp. TaxID=3101350 RepID=UPI003B029301